MKDIKVTTDLVVDAARMTCAVYTSNVRRLAKLGGSASDITLRTEMRRAVLMEELAADDNLCEMFAGRLYQLGHGT